MKTCHLPKLAAVVLALALLPSPVPAADQTIGPGVTISDTRVYDDVADGVAPAAYTFDQVQLAATADVTVVSTYEVVLKPGTTVKNGAALRVTLRDVDGLPNRWEIGQCNTLAHSPSSDPDSDGLTMIQEYQGGTLPCNADSDGDGMPDGWEVAHGLAPTADDAAADPDGDGLTNLQEYQAGTDPNIPVSDGDGMPDGWEVQNGLNPLADDAGLDADGDGLSNLMEYQFGTLANDADSRPPRYNYQYDNNGNLLNSSQP
jgi:hypothetical protein